MLYCDICYISQKYLGGTSPAVQWLRLCASTKGAADSIPGRGTKIPHAAWPKKKKKKYLGGGGGGDNF